MWKVLCLIVNSLFFIGGRSGHLMFRHHRIVADIPLLPGHRVETHLVRVDHGPVGRPARTSSSSSSSDSDDDDRSSGRSSSSSTAARAGPSNDEGGSSHRRDQSVEIVFDSRDQRGEGPDAALLRNLTTFLEVAATYEPDQVLETHFESIIASSLPSSVLDQQ
jgi:hypothetical protein